jgi:hypothetical protein
MAKLIYVANTSLDGYNEDPDDGIDFGAPDEEYFSLPDGRGLDPPPEHPNITGNSGWVGIGHEAEPGGSI